MSPRRAPADPWPRPADPPVERAREVARGYRAIALRAAPDDTRRLDERVTGYGEGDWLTPGVWTFQLDDLLTVAEAAELVGERPGTVDQWRRRGLRSIRTPDGIRITVRDLLDYHAERREGRPRGGKKG